MIIKCDECDGIMMKEGFELESVGKIESNNPSRKRRKKDDL